MSSIYTLSFTDIEGKERSMAEFRGKKLLIVNTASECGYTPQYCQLQELFEHFGGEQFQIIGFPCNDFGKQEPGDNGTVQTFCERNYGVSFTMAAKINITSSPIHPLYHWLTSKVENGKEDAEVKWNFQKFLVEENGGWVKCLSSETLPTDEIIINWINQ